MFRIDPRFGNMHVKDMVAGKTLYYVPLEFKIRVTSPPDPLKEYDTKKVESSSENVSLLPDQYKISVTKISSESPMRISFKTDQNGITEDFEPVD